jgi:hypothetical protein
VKVRTWPHFSARVIFANFAETKLSLSFDIVCLLRIIIDYFLCLWPVRTDRSAPSPTGSSRNDKNIDGPRASEVSGSIITSILGLEFWSVKLN